MNKQLRRLLLIGLGTQLALETKRQFQLNAFALRNKHVLITGGARGLGLVLARTVGIEGAAVSLCSRTSEQVESAVEELNGRGIPAFGRSCDIRDRAAVKELVADAVARFGPIDVLINCAGVITVGPLDTMTQDDYREALDTSFWAVENITREVLPQMRTRKSGRIVNISSIGGLIPVPHLAAYCVGKFALQGYSSVLRRELRSTGVLVTTVSPGLMRTGSHLNASFKGKHKSEFAWFSLSSAMPFLSMDAQTAATKIVQAFRRGDAECVLTIPAKLARLFHAIAPETSAEIAELIDTYVLPGAPANGKARRSGKDSQSILSPSIVTREIDRQALANNETASVVSTDAKTVQL